MDKISIEQFLEKIKGATVTKMATEKLQRNSQI